MMRTLMASACVALLATATVAPSAVMAEPDFVNGTADVGFAFVDGVEAGGKWAGATADGVHEATGVGIVAVTVGFVAGIGGMVCGTVVSPFEGVADYGGVGDGRNPTNDRSIC